MGTITRLSYLLLLWSISLNIKGTTAVGLRNTSTVDIQDQLSQTQLEIDGISTSDSLDEIKNRLSLLVAKFTKLNQLFDLRRAQIDKSCDIVLAMELLTQHLGHQFKDLQTSVDERVEFEKQISSFEEIVDAVRGNNFKLADEKLAKARYTSSLIPKIVHEVYGVNTIDSLLKFSTFLSNTTSKFEVLKTLYEEMMTNDHQEPNIFIAIAEALQTIADSDKPDCEEIKQNASAIVEELTDTVKVTAINFFVRAMRKPADCRTRADFHTLADAFYAFRPNVSDQAMHELVDEIYGRVPANIILEYLSNHTIITQAISGFNALFWKLKNDGRSTSLLRLASSLIELKNRTEFSNLSDDQKDSVEEIIDNMPTCARNLFFNSSAVCFWNKAKDTYLRVGEPKHNFDEHRRNIFSHALNTTKDIPREAVWIPEKKIGERFFFRSAAYPNEYLYVAYHNFSGGLHRVFTWIPGQTDDQFLFTIVLEEDHCYLKSVHFNEYLFASEIKHALDENYSYVYAAKPSRVARIDFVWQVRSC